MEIDRLSRYERDVKKMVKKRKLTQKEIDDTETVFLKDKHTKTLRYHQITCKRDKQRHSITVPNTQYRILFSQYEKIAVFRRLVDHKEYDRINKDC